MRCKSFAVRSRPHRASRNSLDPFPASHPGEANERFASGVNTTHCNSGEAERVPDTFDERAVPSNKRHCLGISEATTRGGGSNLEACIVCDISDELVSRCSGTGCILWFHGECLNPDLGMSEDLAKTYCPYCWFKVLMMKHESVREKAVGAENEVSECSSKESKSKDDSVDRTDVARDQELRGEKDTCSSEKEQLQVENDFDRSREEEMLLTEETDYQPQEDTETIQDAEEDKDEETDYQPEDDTETIQDAEEDKDDEETTNDETTTGAGGKGDVSGEEQDQMQQNERPRRRRRKLILSDSEISSDDSTNERKGEDVTTPSGTMKNRQRKHSSTTKVVKSMTVRDQRKRLFWTPEEEEMLKVGVEKFSAESKNMPWRKILEMGGEVFHETRTPADLKDKWRNMMGGRGKKTN